MGHRRRHSSSNSALLACIPIIVATGMAGCRSAGVPRSDPQVATSVASPASASTLMTREKVDAKRLARQDQFLREFQECPPCFVDRTRGHNQRIFLFDAVADCNTTLRIGTFGDGGKWLCEPERLPASTVVYSFGVGDETSFDHEMAAVFGAEVHMFDPSPSVTRKFESFKAGKPQGPGRIFFHALGLGPVSSAPGKEWSLTIEGQPCAAKSFADIAKSLGHTHVDILKIDVEGGEFGAMPQMLAEKSLAALQVQQILIEFHLWSDESFEKFVQIVQGLKDQGYLLFRKELNPTDASRCAEFAFVRVAAPKQVGE
jgi:hypothetical protein